MKERLDVLLVKQGLAQSREKARAVIMAGDGSRTTPFLPTFSLPASNWGLIRQTICPPSFKRFLAGSKILVREIKDTSTEAKSSLSAISAGVI